MELGGDFEIQIIYRCHHNRFEELVLRAKENKGFKKKKSQDGDGGIN
jgi:hypothetical protein